MMTKEENKKERQDKIKDKIIVFMYCLLFFAIGVIVGRIIEADVGVDSIPKQHYTLMIDNPDYTYCPYCGEKIDKNED